MTAHVLMLLISLLDPIVPSPSVKLPTEPTEAQILAEAQRRANQFCTPSYVYPEGAEPFIVPCAHPIPDCSDTVYEDYPYEARCTGRI